MPRKNRYIIPHIPHHVFQRGNNRQEIFPDKKDKDYFLFKLSEYAHKNDIAIGSYCLMSNHFHLLVYPLSREGLVNLMKFTQYINKKYKRTGKLWENRYKLHIVDPNYEWIVARYIEQNPVRAGMVNRAEDYKYSSARAHLNDVENNILTMNILKDSINEYRKYFKDNISQDTEFNKKIEEIFKQKKVFGGNDFIQQIEEKFKVSFVTRKRGRPSYKNDKINRCDPIFNEKY